MSNEEIINNINNSSGQGENTVIPPAIKKFNFGVCIFNIYWLLWYHQVKPLIIFMILSFVPVIGWLGCLCMLIWMGTQANVWAWKTFHYESVEEFHKIHSTIAKWAIVYLAIPIIIVALICMSFGTLAFGILHGFIPGNGHIHVGKGKQNTHIVKEQTQNTHVANEETQTVDTWEMKSNAFHAIHHIKAINDRLNTSITKYDSKGITDYFYEDFKNLNSKKRISDNIILDDFFKNKYTFVGDGSCLKDTCYIEIDTNAEEGPNELWDGDSPKDIIRLPIKAKSVTHQKVEITIPEKYNY